MSGMTALAAVHTALYAQLQADVALLALVPGGIWDHVPQDPAWPYLRIGNCVEEPMDTQVRQGRIVNVLIHIWSQYRGLAESYGILNRVVDLLRHEMLPLTDSGWSQVLHGTRYVRGEADEPELVEAIQVQHVVAEFDVLVQETVGGVGSPGSPGSP